MPTPAAHFCGHLFGVYLAVRLGLLGELEHIVARSKPPKANNANYWIHLMQGSALTNQMPFNTFNGLAIVVVEDHDDARRYLGLFLSRSGANVVVARDAFEALEAIKKNRPHLVISDIQMPGKDGVELLREIRALGPHQESTVPVIAMTGIVSSAERTRLLNAGFQAYLPKPFGPDKLLETILTVLAK